LLPKINSQNAFFDLVDDHLNLLSSVLKQKKQVALINYAAKKQPYNNEDRLMEGIG